MKIVNKNDALRGSLILMVSAGAGILYFLTTRSGRRFKMNLKNRTQRFIDKVVKTRTDERKHLSYTDPKNSRFDVDRMDNDYVSFYH